MAILGEKNRVFNEKRRQESKEKQKNKKKIRTV